MSWAILRVRAGNGRTESAEGGESVHPQSEIKYCAVLPTREAALAAIERDFEQAFQKDNPASLGGHLEVHEIKVIPKST